MRVIIAGPRDYHNEDYVFRKLDKLFRESKDIEIVSGEATGVDTIVKNYATARGLKYKGFPADWKKGGRAAGPLRNGQMAEYGQCLVAFWNLSSTGTRDMITQARRNGLEVLIYVI